MKLLIVESPGKVKKIQAILGAGWRVAASVGHVRDLPINSTAVYPPDFKPLYEQTERGSQVIERLRDQASGAEQIYLATDPDREGEAIAWHLQESLGLGELKRISFTEITERAVKKALNNPRPIDMALVRAQEGRRVLDRLVGYQVSPLVRNVSGQNLSAGRVQSPALRLVVEREEAIRAFKPESFYGVEMTFKGPWGTEKENWKASWNPKNWLPEGQERFKDLAVAKKVAALDSLKVASYEEGKQRQAPAAPFITSTLQQAASNVLKLDPKVTMAKAQSLYEDGLITYMRTDSPNISPEAVKEIRDWAESRRLPIPSKPRHFKAKEGAQEAHEAIRPTHIEVEEAGPDKITQALYKLIRDRALASQLDDAVYDAVKAVLVNQIDSRQVIFEAKGRRLIQPGWRTVVDSDQSFEKGASKDKEADETNNPVPKLEIGEDCQPISSEVKSKKTIAPARYTQASLIRDLERRGIGRPSTYAAIMDNIVSRGYVRADFKRQLASTLMGDQLMGYLKSRFGFVDYDYTKNLEEKLDNIAEGKLDYLSVVTEVNSILITEIINFTSSSGLTCAECGGPLSHMVGTKGEKAYDFWACRNKELCGATFENLNGHPGVMTIHRISEHSCPQCGLKLHRLYKQGPDGYNYWVCRLEGGCGSKFNDLNGAPGSRKVPPQVTFTDFKCQKCGQQLKHIVKESPEGYNFWACSDKVCGAKYRDHEGIPGVSFGEDEVKHSCPQCGLKLRHNYKQGPGGYNYWVCREEGGCGSNFNDFKGAPGSKREPPQVTLTDIDCPKCGRKLKHVVKEPPGGYNFWVCSDNLCALKYNDLQGAPVLTKAINEEQFSCPECGGRLRRSFKEGFDGLYFWTCLESACGSKFIDDNGRPNQKFPTKVKLTDCLCPICGQKLKRVEKIDGGSYIFWVCSSKECSSRFDDNNGLPGDLFKYESTEYLCPVCSSPLNRSVKEGPRGFDHFSCPNFECQARFKSQDGALGERLDWPKTERIRTQFKCQSCDSVLYRKSGRSLRTGRDYDFFSCSNVNCRRTFPCFNDQLNFFNEKTTPAPEYSPLDESLKSEPSNEIDKALDHLRGDSRQSDYNCPQCGAMLEHKTGFSHFSGRDYDFFACPNRNCRKTFKSTGGAPLF
ncbi:MAG: type I DNA topoisomerase [Deltaproteobacteria bacterium]|jgi:DNA topoisomerase-1|nr:type I DNA topoisomerase [Deltaproteobacteria bacterium]